MVAKKIIYLLTFLLVIPSVYVSRGQDKGTPVYDEKHEATVRLVLVDVIATDNKGNFINDLHIEDFLIFEDGEKVAINSMDLINFNMTGILYPERKYIEKKTIPVQMKRKNRFFIVFDSLNTIRRVLNRSKDRILEKLIELVKAGGEIMIFEITEEGNAQILQTLTSDEALITQAINKASGSIWVEKTRDDLNVPKIWFEDEYRNLVNKYRIAELLRENREKVLPIKAQFEYMNRMRFEKSLSGLLSIMNMIKAYPGRKPLLLISGGFPSLSLDKYFPAGIYSTVGHSDLNAAKIDDPFRVLGKNRQRYGEDIFENLIQFANSHNITFYTMDPDIYLRHVFSDMTFDSFFNIAEYSDIKQDELSKLKILSAETGGFTLQGANKYNQFQKLLESDLQSYYELSYYPKRKKADGKYHKIEVKVKRPEIKIRHRQGYYDYTDEQETSLLFASASANPGLFRAISFRAQAVPFITNKDKYRLWINMALPVKDLILGGNPNTYFKILKMNIRVDNENGEHAFNAQLDIPIKLSKSQRTKFKNARFYGYNTCSNELKLKKARYKIIFSLYDEETHRLGTVEQTMSVPASGELRPGEVVCAVFGYLMETRKRARSFSLSGEDGSLLVDKLKFHPLATNQFYRDRIYLFLQVYSENNRSHLKPHFELTNGDVFQGNLEGRIVKEAWNKKANIRNMIIQLNFLKFNPGEYFLNIKMGDETLSEAPSRRIKIRLL